MSNSRMLAFMCLCFAIAAFARQSDAMALSAIILGVGSSICGSIERAAAAIAEREQRG